MNKSLQSNGLEVKEGEPETPPSSELKKKSTCRCGNRRGHHRVHPDYSYGLMGLFNLLSFGMSAVPKKVEWKCAICKEIVETITDPAELKRYRYRAPKD
jgi:hypothetical protein